MAQILCFSRNRSVQVEKIDDQIMRASCRLQDPILEAYVEIRVKLPDLEIVAVDGQVTKSLRKDQFDMPDSLKGAVGIRIGPGLKKILRGGMGKTEDQKQLTFMIEECCGGVILAFTKEVMLEVPKDKKLEKDYFHNRVKTNIRLYNSCAAFAPGSPLVEGIEPPH